MVPRVQKSSSLSKVQVMSEQESEQDFLMVLIFTRASTDSQGWPQAIKHGPRQSNMGSEFFWGRVSISSVSWDP